MTSAFVDDFGSALAALGERRPRDPSRFWQHWFWEKGTCLFFLFRKNLRVTNIQFAELIALINLHLRFPGHSRAPHLRFLNVIEFNSSIRRLDETFNLSSTHERNRAAKMYAQQFGQTLVIDPFYCSCALYLPPLLQVDLEAICGESGYIHSCGSNLFTKLVYQTRIGDLYKSLDRFFEHKVDSKSRFFAVYAREDWPSESETNPKALQDGREYSKIAVNKFFMGPHRLPDVLEKIQKRYTRRLIFVARPGRFGSDHSEAKRDDRLEDQKLIWLLTDQQAGEHPRNPGEKRFYICYEQQYVNENAFYLFDENKPAWIDHTTIPHTLAAAMTNISRPWWPQKARVCDPFSGSGTLWLETAKLPDVEMICSDINPSAPVLTNDNLHFFRSPDLKKWRDTLKGLQAEDWLRSGKLSLKYQAARKAFEAWQVAYKGDDYATLRRVLSQLSDQTSRFIFYVMLKVSKRNNIDIGNNAWRVLFNEEVKQELKSLRTYTELKGRTESGRCPIQAVSVVRGRFSKSCYVDSRCLPEHAAVKVRKATTLARYFPGQLDLIVTDPPYGFNTEEDKFELGNLYQKMVRAFLSSLRDNGQLVFAVPEWSHTGRQMPAFTYKEFLIHEVLMEASRIGIDVVRPPYSMPYAGTLFRAPFYWESEKSLRRAVLHFRFHRRTQKRIENTE